MILAASIRPADGGLLVAVGVLLFFAALLALAETSLVGMSKVRARALEEQGHHGARALRRLVDNTQHFLAPVLLLVLVCQLVAATLVGVVADRLFGTWGIFAATVFEVVVIFVVAEAIPKDWAVRHPDRSALFAATFVSTVIAFPPISLAARALIGFARFVTPGDFEPTSHPDLTESELLALADVAVEEDVIAHEERAIISSIIEFGDTVVREVMAPRTDIVAVEHTLTAGEALERALDAGLSRVPVYKENLDDIVGIAYTRDLMRSVRDGKDETQVAAIFRKARYVPETKRVAPLLREMQREQFHLAVVVDEYGGTAGLVTLEDLIEELVGEIADEFDVEEALIEPLGDDGYRVPGKMAVDEVNELLDADFPVGDWDTIGGLLLHLSGQVPTEGDAVEIAGHTLIAEHVLRRRIGKVRIIATETTKGTTVNQSEDACS